MKQGTTISTSTCILTLWHTGCVFLPRISLIGSWISHGIFPTDIKVAALLEAISILSSPIVKRSSYCSTNCCVIRYAAKCKSYRLLLTRNVWPAVTAGIASWSTSFFQSLEIKRFLMTAINPDINFLLFSHFSLFCSLNLNANTSKCFHTTQLEQIFTFCLPTYYQVSKGFQSFHLKYTHGPPLIFLILTCVALMLSLSNY